jgi:hypothetical protein
LFFLEQGVVALLNPDTVTFRELFGAHKVIPKLKLEKKIHATAFPPSTSEQKRESQAKQLPSILSLSS